MPRANRGVRGLILKTPVWRFVAYAIVILIGIAITLPSFLPRETVRAFPGWLPDRPVALGLDLRGGASLTLRADETALADEMVADARVEIGEALETAGIPVRLMIEGRELVIVPRTPDGPISTLRTAVESALPTFQRGTLSASESVFLVAETDANTLRLTMRDAALEGARSPRSRPPHGSAASSIQGFESRFPFPESRVERPIYRS